MAEPLKVAPAPTVLYSEVRRFDLPDLDRHAAWFLPRLIKEYPHLNERSAIGFLRSVLYDNTYLFLYQEKGVALAQVLGAGGLDAEGVVWERFVWVADPTDEGQKTAAASFYPQMLKWAKQLGIDVVHVENKSDVPRELIKSAAGRVFETAQAFLRVKA